MKSLRLHRRTLLQGAGGVGIALPWLEAMVNPREASAQTATPKRYLVFFDGQSTGADNDVRHNDFAPTTVGRNYDLKSALAPLGATPGLKDEVSVISGLEIPTAYSNGGAVPAGGRSDDFHVTSASPLLSGMRTAQSGRCNGPTSDQVVAQAIAGNTRFHSLVYRVQAGWYLSVSAPYGRDLISYKRDASGNVVAIPAQTSPQQAFQALFSNFQPSGADAETAARLDFELRSRRSVLDLVRGRTDRLLSQLGTEDRQRMARHFDEIRDLEQRVAATPPAQVGACVKPANPGADPALGGNQGTNGDANTYSQNLGYSGEEERAKLFCDLIHMAFACDLTRVATLQMTMFQSHLNMHPITGQATDLHEIGHNGVPGGTLAVSKGIAWHVKHFAYLVQKLKDTPEAGGNMLDSSALAFLLEGGHGFDPGGQKNNSAHSTENMVCLLAGRAGGLKPGQHVVAAGKHPANVLLTAMKAVGYTGSALGEVSGDIPQLRT